MESPWLAGQRKQNRSRAEGQERANTGQNNFKRKQMARLFGTLSGRGKGRSNYQKGAEDIAQVLLEENTRTGNLR